MYPRVAMQILRNTDFSLTMEICTLASSAATRAALESLGESLDELWPYFAAARTTKAPSDDLGQGL